MRRAPQVCARVLLGLVLSGLAPWIASNGAGPEEPSPEVRERLESIRKDVVDMRFEQALGAIDEVLGRPGLSAAERAGALVLRAEAHAAFGDFDAVERDYSEILGLRPGFAPDPGLTPAKAMQRFEKVRAKTVGRIALSLDPPDATVLVDGRESTPDGSGTLWVLAGSHTLRAERAGNDPAQQAVEVVAGGSLDVKLALVPNARTVILRSVPEGVRVTFDGKSVGQTAREVAGDGAPPQPAQLVLENLPLGEHVFELSKECYRTERLTDTLAVDLLDRSPKSYQVVRMVDVRTPLELRGGPASAEVRVDGKTVGRLPVESLETCPGTREISIVYRDRMLWRERAELREGVEAVFEVTPRPNAALVGAGEWPAELSGFGAAFNTIEVRERPARADLTDASGYAELGLPQQIDLVLAVLPGDRVGATGRFYLFSPILRAVTPLVEPPAVERPRWATTSWGLGSVDSEAGGPARVVRVRPASPAAEAGLAPGDRVLEVGGRAVASAREVASTLEAARPDKPMRVKWRSLSGQEREADLVGRPSPLLVHTSRERSVEAMVRAAWAVVDGLALPREASSAMANLGLLLSEFGQDDLAAEVWRRVDWGGRDGIGEGTKQYYLGRLLERSGREREAEAAYRRAAESRATAFTDDGPPIALAARDRLVDLGVASGDATVSLARPAEPLSAR